PRCAGGGGAATSGSTRRVGCPPTVGEWILCWGSGGSRRGSAGSRGGPAGFGAGGRRSEPGGGGDTAGAGRRSGGGLPAPHRGCATRFLPGCVGRSRLVGGGRPRGGEAGRRGEPGGDRRPPFDCRAVPAFGRPLRIGRGSPRSGDGCTGWPGAYRRSRLCGRRGGRPAATPGGRADPGD